MQITDLTAVNKAFFLSGSQTDTEIVCVCVQKCMPRVGLRCLAPNVSLLDKWPVISKLEECVPTWLLIVLSLLVIAPGAHHCSLLCDKDDRNLIKDRGCLYTFSQKYFPHRMKCGDAGFVEASKGPFGGQVHANDVIVVALQYSA